MDAVVDAPDDRSRGNVAGEAIDVSEGVGMLASAGTVTPALVSVSCNMLSTTRCSSEEMYALTLFPAQK